MENLIKQLVEYDHKGQKIILEAKAKATEIEKNIEEAKKDLENDYQKKIDVYRDNLKIKSDKKLQIEFTQDDQRNNEILNKMQKNFEENKENWIQHIVGRCIKY